MKHLKLVVVVGLLEVNYELLLTVADDKDTDGTRALTEGSVDLLGKITLGNDLDTSLDLTVVGLDEESGIITGLDDLVLLEGRGQHGVDDNRWGWVADNTDFLTEFAREQINTQVTVLAGGGRSGDADDLRWALLEDDQVTDTDVVAWDGEVRACDSNWSSWSGGGCLGLSDGLNNYGLALRNGISICGLGVVGLRDLGLGGLDGVESPIDLATEVLKVVVVEVGVLGRHLAGFLG